LNTGNNSKLKTIELGIPDDWRYGQTIFNFLEWLANEKKVATNQSVRMADPFHLSNNEFTRYYNEYIKQLG